MDLGLDGKVALVTGAARDIGEEIAVALAADGVAVAVNYRSSRQEADQVVSRIEAAGGKAKAYGADVTDYEAVTAMAAAIRQDLGPVTVLVNNAGYVQPNKFLDTTPDEWKRQIDVGLYGVIHTCHAVAPQMIEAGGGRIVNLAGDSARVGEARLAITAASRGGVLALTKSLAKELGPDNISVNTVALGLVETAHSDKDWLEKYRDRIERQYPLRRIGVASDVAPTVVFLASEASGWVTGQILSVNGGYAMVG